MEKTTRVNGSRRTDMSHQLWGPFHLIPNCRLWVAEDRACKDATESAHDLKLAETLLTDQDRDRWNRYRPLKKKRQFLNSLRNLLTALFLIFGQVMILKRMT